jgi:hypothetical protein
MKEKGEEKEKAPPHDWCPGRPSTFSLFCKRSIYIIYLHHPLDT